MDEKYESPTVETFDEAEVRETKKTTKGKNTDCGTGMKCSTGFDCEVGHSCGAGSSCGDGNSENVGKKIREQFGANKTLENKITQRFSELKDNFKTE